MRVESSPGHSPVSTISWSPRANFIISGSPADTNLIVWDVPMGLATRVRRTEGGGVNLVVVAPNGGRVFAASVGNVMRVWETETWTCEKWTQSTGRCKVNPSPSPSSHRVSLPPPPPPGCLLGSWRGLPPVCPPWRPRPLLPRFPWQ